VPVSHGRAKYIDVATPFRNGDFTSKIDSVTKVARDCLLACVECNILQVAEAVERRKPHQMYIIGITRQSILFLLFAQCEKRGGIVEKEIRRKWKE
jgi:hypothetical protein